MPFGQYIRLVDLPHTEAHRKYSEDVTLRNIYMGKFINKLLPKFKNIAHIGGRYHYNPAFCIPLQKLIIAESIEIVDAVNETKYTYR